MERALVSRDFISNSIDPRLTRNSSSQTPHTCPANSSGKAPVRLVPPVPSVTTLVLRPRLSASILQRYVDLAFSLKYPYIHICNQQLAAGLGWTSLGWATSNGFSRLRRPSVLLYTVHGRQDSLPQARGLFVSFLAFFFWQTNC